MVPQPRNLTEEIASWTCFAQRYKNQNPVKVGVFSNCVIQKSADVDDQRHLLEMNKRQVAEAFRERLSELLRSSGLSQTSFAGESGVDRSTLSQLLNPDAVRVPRADTLAAVASYAQVSVDWLLGLSQEGALGTDVVQEAMAIEPGPSSPADARLARWHAEATGYKIRYVPSTLPDLLKTEDVVRYETDPVDTSLGDRHVQQVEVRLEYNRRPETDVEACCPMQSLMHFAHGEGIWSGLTRLQRRRQFDTMVGLLDELYPTFRLFLFDGRTHYCAPMTVFGPLRAALYLGQTYLVINSTEHIRLLAAHFDQLIRAAVMHHDKRFELIESVNEKN